MSYDLQGIYKILKLKKLLNRIDALQNTNIFNLHFTDSIYISRNII